MSAFLPMMLQAAGWVAPTVAVSLGVLALVSVTVLVVLLLGARKAARGSEALAAELASIRRELEPAVRGVREAAEAGRTLAGRLEEEVHAVIHTSQRIRHDVERGVRRARHRLSDLDALAEVVQGEIEETALDVAATLRTVRRGKGMIGRIRRLIRGRR